MFGGIVVLPAWLLLLLLIGIALSISFIAGVLHSKERDKQRGERLNVLIGLGALVAIVLAAILAIIYAKEIFLFAVVEVIVTIVSYKLIFTREKIDKIPDASISENLGSQFLSLTKYSNGIIILNFVGPLVAYCFVYFSRFSIGPESARLASSDIFLVSSGLLVIIVTFTIFTFERSLQKNISQKVSKLLIERFKGLSVIYVVTALLSALSLLLMTNEQLIFTPPSPLRNSLFLWVLYFLFVSITLTLAVYLQVAKVYEEPPAQQQD